MKKESTKYVKYEIEESTELAEQRQICKVRKMKIAFR
jgi:hypothetical protein